MDKPHQGLQPIYLDNAATTRPLPEVILTMGQVLYDTFANPSSTHTAGRDAKVVVETSRREIAALLGARGSQVFLPPGGRKATIRSCGGRFTRVSGASCPAGRNIMR